MDSKELRIGNYVTDGNYTSSFKRYGMVLSVSSKSVTLKMPFSKIKITSNKDFDGVDVMPIKLTQDIVEKCGFNNVSSNEYWVFYTLINGFRISLALHDEPSAGVKYGRFYYGDSFDELNYLHQLQNFYKAKTNKELEVIL